MCSVSGKKLSSQRISSKLCFVKISQVSKKLRLFNHKRAEFLAPKFSIFYHLSASLKLEISVSSQVLYEICLDLWKVGQNKLDNFREMMHIFSLLDYLWKTKIFQFKSLEMSYNLFQLNVYHLIKNCLT